jgi:predicted nucleic acid-binding protein
LKDLFQNLIHTPINSPLANGVTYLIDTCFLYFVFSKHEKAFIEFTKNNVVGLTSFTVGEVLFHLHDVDPHIRSRIRKAISNGLLLTIIDVDVKPGDPYGEREFVDSYDKQLLNLIPDPSDAVLAAIATSIHASILTRDKHHLFTSKLENYFQQQNLAVLNNLP